MKASLQKDRHRVFGSLIDGLGIGTNRCVVMAWRCRVERTLFIESCYEYKRTHGSLSGEEWELRDANGGSMALEKWFVDRDQVGTD